MTAFLMISLPGKGYKTLLSSDNAITTCIMNWTQGTFQEDQHSLKSCFADSTMADANSKSFNSIVSNTRRSEMKLEFEFKHQPRVPIAPEQPLQQRKTSACASPRIITGIPQESKRQEFRSPSKWINRYVQQTKVQVKRMLEAPSLRDRFAHLLPQQMKLKVGYLHCKLMNKMHCMDRCIIIINRGTNKKSLLAKEIQQYLRSMKETVEDNDIRQIIFLNENFGKIYYIEWVQKEGTLEYQLSIRILEDVPYEEKSRKSEVRRSICNFLLSKYAEHLGMREVEAEGMDLSRVMKWGYNFNVEDVQIPLGNFPPHPLQKKLPLSKREPSDDTSSNNLKQIIEDTISLKKKQEQQPPQSKKVYNFKNKLYDSIRVREEQHQNEKKLKMRRGKEHNKQELTRFCQQACGLFIERRVSTMFRINFLGLMMRRLKEYNYISEVQETLNQVMQLGVKFLSNFQSHRGMMLHITKQNYNHILTSIRIP